MSKRKIARNILVVIFSPIILAAKAIESLMHEVALVHHWLWELDDDWSKAYHKREIKKIWSSPWLT